MGPDWKKARLHHSERNLEGGRRKGRNGGKGEGSRQHDLRNQHRWVDEKRGLMPQSKCWGVNKAKDGQTADGRGWTLIGRIDGRVNVS
ncbi:MAG: hypothetical protein GX442_02205 [Candidatus Riflebacteria bacterium]|nr:hypothetical protein [Candidatus Riflebacteria bacterium]